MVKYGLFGLGLARAETNEWTSELYQEHSCPESGSIYAEVEPDDEFYLQLRSDAPEAVYADLRVDGVLIEKGRKIRPGTTRKVGIYREDVADSADISENALRFARARIYNSREQATAYWTGQVEVTFYGNPKYRIPEEASPKPYPRDGPKEQSRAAVVTPPRSTTSTIDSECTYAARKSRCYINTSLADTDIGYVPGKSAENQKKGVKSAEGTTTLRQVIFKPSKLKKNNSKKKKKPEYLGTITLRYCSTIGLIYAGILPTPPLWEAARSQEAYIKRKRDDDWKALSDAKVTKLELTSERINNKGEKVVEKKEVDLFDLTDE